MTQIRRAPFDTRHGQLEDADTAGFLSTGAWRSKPGQVEFAVIDARPH
jgi:hypothetical protein